jgi:hypothetical protein
VEYENKVVGVLEARFRSPKAFRDDDVRTCELMAVLVKEVIARAGQPQAAQEVELEREPEPPPVALSEELIGIGEAEIVVSDFTDEKHEIPGIAPALPHQLSKPPRILPVAEAEEVVTAPVIRSGAEPVSLDLTLCRGCGQHLAEDELYCGKCGTERIIRPDSPLQSKWASLWYMNQARRAAEEQEDESLAAAQEAAAISKPQGLSKPGALDLAGYNCFGIRDLVAPPMARKPGQLLFGWGCPRVTRSAVWSGNNAGTGNNSQRERLRSPTHFIRADVGRLGNSRGTPDACLSWQPGHSGLGRPAHRPLLLPRVRPLWTDRRRKDRHSAKRPNGSVRTRASQSLQLEFWSRLSQSPRFEANCIFPGTSNL